MPVKLVGIERVGPVTGPMFRLLRFLTLGDTLYRRDRMRQQPAGSGPALLEAERAFISPSSKRKGDLMK